MFHSGSAPGNGGCTHLSRDHKTELAASAMPRRCAFLLEQIIFLSDTTTSDEGFNTSSEGVKDD